ncbi:thyroid hormone receptor-associated protein 3 isoform X2 [Austrofundulus limnaeus]|uniref:Thyroid hormone receptor-associated protein 3 isoform X2 n=1 Tax=Austrofundulus limnaeus TaxID=52670 RepID=A0A2I4C222_AUSLI|nr:PREDICTED: thyroid hormone receptor-associated protein 3-like isoform X2 [Austrofundulus limnaeus]
MTKHSGSRSRSRSHSPFYNREKKYPKAYQNNREFRGYNRGFRRPYNFRGRGRGQFFRGRYQRGGGGYYNNNNNNNYRPNWKNWKQYPQKQQQQQFNHSRGRSHHVQKHSGSPPQGQSHRSDRSSSPLSRHSQRSSSSSHSSSPKCHPASMVANQNLKDVNEQHLASNEVQKGGGGDEEPGEHVGVLAGDAREGADCGKTERTWQSLTDCSSPKKNSPVASTAVIVGQSGQTAVQSTPTKITNDTCNSSPMWEKASGSSSAKKPSNEGLNSMLPSFDFFTSEDFPDGDKTAISIAFKKFLEEHNKKAKCARENGKKIEANDVDTEKDKLNWKSFSAGVSDSGNEKHRENTEREMSLNSFLKASPFLSAEVEEDDEMTFKPSSKPLHKEWHNGEETFKPKSKVTHSAQKLFEACFSKWQNAAFSQFEHDTAVEETYRSEKQEKAIAAALAKRELATKFEEVSPKVSCKMKKMEKSPSDQCSDPPLRQKSDRESFTVRGVDSPPMASRTQEAKFNVRMDYIGDNLTSSSDVLAEERQLSQDLVQSSKKPQEFRSIFQHVQVAQPQKSPSELFAQHIVTIVHHVKAQHFPSSGMTLNERFTLYQRQAAKKETMKPRKSPEIHRRIDVSPSAFRKHPQLFEAMKSSEDGTYKDAAENVKADPMDLRLDIERRKKYSTHPKDYSQDRGRDAGNSPDFDRGRSEEIFSKFCKIPKKNYKKRSRSSSSSSSSSSKSQKDEHLHDSFEVKGDFFNKAQLDQRESPGNAEGAQPPGGVFQKIQIRGRGWSKGSNQGNSSYSSQMNRAGYPENEDWDPKVTPKSKAYYLHDDRESTWLEAQERGQGSLLHGRARFIIRKATGSTNTISPKWTHDKFQAKREQGGKDREETDQDHKEEDIDGQNA